MLVDGDLAALATLQAEEDQLRLLGEAAAITSDFEVQLYEGGSEATISDGVRRYATSLAELGYL